MNNNNRRRNFRPRPQKNNFRRRSSSLNSSSSNSHNSNGNFIFNRNGSMNNIHNVEKTMQKYQQLAKDAQSNGDPVLSQNYLQHADHYLRRYNELNERRDNLTEKITQEEKSLPKEESFKMLNKLRIIHPVPVPISKNVISFFPNLLNNSSTSSSVSGLGIKVFLFT